MPGLTLYLVLMMLLASFFVILPVWRYQGQVRNEQDELRKQQNIFAFEQSKQELEASLADKLLSHDEYHTLRTELELNFLEDMENQADSNRSSASSYTRALPLSLLLIILLGSFMLYRQIGSEQELAIPALLEQLQAATSEQEQLAGLQEIAEILDARLSRRSSDIQTGFTLGTLYISLDRFDDAVRVFNQLAGEMTEEDADKATVLGQLAQAQYLRDGSNLTPAVQATMDQALQINSNEQAIMSLLAYEAFVSENYPQAIAYWRRQISQLTPGSAQVAELNQRIATIEDLIGLEQESPAGGGVSVTVQVDIDDAIRDQIEPDMRLFIFARSESMPVPLAARDFAISEFPLTVTLDESMSMMPQFSLASVDSVFVGATIARDATAQQGGFRAVSESFELEGLDAPIELFISEPAP
jgi:cytochrome c-type biogenesis protein CcmH